MKNKILISLVAVLTAIALSGIIVGLILIVKKDKVETPQTVDDYDKGVWWWDNRLDSSYLDFAREHGVTEIYYYASEFNESINEFIGKAADKNIKVYWLCGKYEWIENSSDLFDKIEKYMNFQESNKNKFDGIHFDIEPHQHPDFESDRERLVTAFVQLTFDIAEKYPDIHTTYDIPFWLDDQVTVNETTKAAYKFVTDNADMINVMSYRDTAENIFDCAREEYEYALSEAKQFRFGVETSENDEDIVTFYEEGAAYMNEQLALLRQQTHGNCGIAVHHIRSWRELKE